MIQPVHTSFAVMFPGQGSQRVGMLAPFFNEAPFRSVVKTASELLGYDIQTMVLDGSQDILNQTIYTQPLIYTLSYALWCQFKETETRRPCVMAGHSLGEWTALAAAEAISFEDGLRLVQIRAQAMQDAVGEGYGMMAVLGLDFQTAAAAISELSDVYVANDNAAKQVVIAGRLDAFDAASKALRKAGAKRSVILGMSVPSHCPLMQSAANQLADALDGVALSTPVLPVIQNVNATPTTDLAIIREHLINQVTKPVQWVKTLQALQTFSIEQILECGPGKVLKDLARRALTDIEIKAVEFDDVFDTINMD